MRKVTLVIPCCNEEEVLPLFYRETTAVLRQLPVEYKLFFIDDGSSDGTLSLLREICRKDEHAACLSFTRNFGKEAAVYAGLSRAEGDYIGIMDADLQDPPCLLPEMLKLLETGSWDCVIALRKDRKGEGIVRSLLSKCFYTLLGLFSKSSLPQGVRDYRLMTEAAAKAVAAAHEKNRFFRGIFAYTGFRAAYCTYENSVRKKGSSKWSILSLYKYSLDALFSNPREPLGGSILLGVLSVLGGIAGFLPLPSSRKKENRVLLLLLGTLLFSSGIREQYAWRIYEETRKRPHYILKGSERVRFRGHCTQEENML